MDTADVSRVPEDVLRNVEADTYWCLSRLLDGIQVSAPPRARGRGAGSQPTAEPPGGHPLPSAAPVSASGGVPAPRGDSVCLSVRLSVGARVPP